MDNYQAIYDAVRSRIAGGNINEAVAEVARQAFDISYLTVQASTALQEVSESMLRPSVLYRPALSIDGNQWCALYGADLQDGVAGFGDTPEAAMADFDANWTRRLATVQP